jgi:hypothetical protein
MRASGISGQRNGLYLSRTILVGTNDPETTFGEPVVQYTVYSKPQRFSFERHAETGNGYWELEELEVESAALEKKDVGLLPEEYPNTLRVCQFVYGDLTKPDSWFSKFVEPINRMYCETHGYDYVVDRLDSVRQDRHGNWEKVPHILRHLSDCNYLFFLDADAVFYSHVIALHEELFPRLESQHLMMFSADCGGETYRWHPHLVNAGTGLFRNTQATKEILQDWDATSEMPEFKEYRWRWCLEQRTLIDYIFPKYQDKIKILQDYYLMNGMFGQFIRHFIHIGSGVDANPFDHKSISEWRHQECERLYHSPMMERNRLIGRTAELRV